MHSGCSNMFLPPTAARIGPWISCSAKSVGATIQVHQMRTYATTPAGETLIDTSDFNSATNCWAGLYSWSEWQAGRDTNTPLPCDGSEYQISSTGSYSQSGDDGDPVYHAGSRDPHATAPDWYVHIPLPSGANTVRVEADISVGGSVSCMVGADVFTAQDERILDAAGNNTEVAESSWTGSQCWPSITLSSRNSNGTCPVFPTVALVEEWIYTWILPTLEEPVDTIKLHDYTNYDAPICSKPSENIVSCRSSQKVNPFTWSGSIGSTEVVWSSGWVSGPQDCRNIGSLTVQFNGTTYTPIAVPYKFGAMDTCQSIIP